jgi:hypothetical protein
LHYKNTILSTSIVFPLCVLILTSFSTRAAVGAEIILLIVSTLACTYLIVQQESLKALSDRWRKTMLETSDEDEEQQMLTRNTNGSFDVEMSDLDLETLEPFANSDDEGAAAIQSEHLTKPEATDISQLVDIEDSVFHPADPDPNTPPTEQKQHVTDTRPLTSTSKSSNARKVHELNERRMCAKCVQCPYRTKCHGILFQVCIQSIL